MLDVLREKSFSKHSYQEKCELIRAGQPTPLLENLCATGKSKTGTFARKFHIETYAKYKWLCGCDKFSKLFCWPCVLFLPAGDRSIWIRGYSDLNHFHTAAEKHSVSKTHINNVLTIRTFGELRVDMMLDKHKRDFNAKHNKQVDENRNIMRRLISVACFLGTQELAFRGNDESHDSVNRGNYVELLHLIGSYDQPLFAHLRDATTFKGMCLLLTYIIIFY